MIVATTAFTVTVAVSSFWLGGKFFELIEALAKVAAKQPRGSN